MLLFFNETVNVNLEFYCQCVLYIYICSILVGVMLFDGINLNDFRHFRLSFIRTYIINAIIMAVIIVTFYWNN